MTQLTAIMLLFSIIHIFEPVPTFNKVLTKKWEDHKVKNDWDVTIHKFGLGSKDRYIISADTLTELFYECEYILQCFVNTQHDFM